MTVKASKDKQYVTQAGGVSDEPQTSDTVIGQTGSDTTSTANTITVEAESGQTAEVTLSGVNIDASGEDKAAMSTSGAGGVTITLLGQNALRSGWGHAGLEKNNAGNLTVTAKDTDQSLTAWGGSEAAGIGGRFGRGTSDITVSGGTVRAIGGDFAAGIGGGCYGNGTGIAISGGRVTATGAVGAAGIGGGYDGWGSGIAITGGEIAATGGDGSAGIGGGNGGSGSDIAVTGGKVTAKGGTIGAGIGGGLDGGCSDITVSGSAQLRAQGGGRSELSEGSGAPIGNGGSRIGSSTPVDGAEVTPDTSKLSCDGRIEYYAAGVDMDTSDPVRAVNGGNHDFTAETADAAYLKSAATCTERAVYYTSCAACGLSSKGTDDEKTFGYGDPLDHRGGEATCVRRAVCEACGEEYGELDPARHEHLAHVAAKAATTKSEGNTEYWCCKDCKRYFSDAAGTKEIKQSDTVIPKKSESEKDEENKSDGKKSDEKEKGKGNKRALPATGDGTTAQTAALLAGSLAALGAALITKRRTA